MLMFATKIKPDVHDKSLNFGPRIAAGFNADHDGDALWVILIKEQGLARMMFNMHPKEHILSGVSLGLSGYISLTLQSFAHFNSFLVNCEKENFPCNLSLEDYNGRIKEYL